MLVFGADHDKLDYKLSNCCNPIPGDEVFGFITINEGIKVHKKDCPNAISLQSNYAYRIIMAKWIDSSQQEFKAILHITGMDTMGLTNKLTKEISRQHEREHSKHILEWRCRNIQRTNIRNRAKQHHLETIDGQHQEN